MLLIASLTSREELVRPLVELTETREWDMLVCPDPNAAPGRLRRERPDLIVMDDWLAVSHQGEVIMQALRAHPKLQSVPTLVISDLIDCEIDRPWFSRQGFTHACLITDWDELEGAIEKAVATGHRQAAASVSLTVS